MKKFSPEGEKFDPNVHQAMYEVQDSDLPPGHVAQVIQAGYMLGDRVLRPALVGVAKAAPKAPQSSANDNPQSDSAAESKIQRSSMPSRTARKRVNSASQSSLRPTPTTRKKPPPPKRTHCTSKIGSPLSPLACALIS